MSIVEILFRNNIADLLGFLYLAPYLSLNGIMHKIKSLLVTEIKRKWSDEFKLTTALLTQIFFYNSGKQKNISQSTAHQELGNL